MKERWKIDRGYVYWWLRAPRKLWFRVPDGWESSHKNPSMFFNTFQEALVELKYQLLVSRYR